ncbi:hypothetical protein BH23ACT7_BH23ACT7_03430 [soil metagenome]|jgi:hydrogenase maturation protease
MTVLVGGVGQLFQGDLDLGRVAADRLAAEDLGHGVLVEELHYGAVAVAQRLQDLAPDALVLIGAEQRGRVPGTVERRRVAALELDPEAVQVAVRDAITGYVTIDLVLEVAAGLGALPARTVTIEVEPARTDPGEGLSPEAETGLAAALQLVRAEARRTPLLGVAEELRGRLAGDRLEPSPATEAMAELLAELDGLDREGRWGRAFSLGERVRHAIAAGATPERMEHLDWALWWTLLEELDRLLPVEGVSGPE